MKKTIATFALLAAGVWLLSAEIINRIVAVVNDEPITRYAFNEQKKTMQSQAKAMGQRISDAEVLEGMIGAIVLKQEGAKRGVVVTQNEIDSALRQQMTANRIPDMSSFEKALVSQGLTLDAYKKQIENQIIMQNLFREVVAIREPSDEEARAFFDKNKNTAMFAQSERIHVSWTLVKVPPGAGYKEQADKAEKITQAREAALATRNFSSVVQRYSEDVDTKAKGGELGVFTRDMANTSPVARLAFEMFLQGKKAGAISEIKQTEEGLWFIRLNSIEKGAAPTFESAKNEIKNLLYEQKAQDEFNAWLERQVARAVVERML